MTSDTEVKQGGADITLSPDEFEMIKKKVLDADDLANKRVAAALAQVWLITSSWPKTLQSHMSALDIRSGISMECYFVARKHSRLQWYAEDGYIHPWWSVLAAS